MKVSGWDFMYEEQRGRQYQVDIWEGPWGSVNVVWRFREPEREEGIVEVRSSRSS